MTTVQPAGDDLVERLRAPMVMSMYLTIGDLYADAMAQRREAADTIEALRREKREAVMQVLASDGQAQEAYEEVLSLRSRLLAAEKALEEGLHFITNIDNAHPSVRQIRSAINQIRGKE